MPRSRSLSETLLGWGSLIPARPATSADDLNPEHSALEVPWSLWLAVPKGGAWHHSATPVTSGGRTELWHTRLGIGGSEPPAVLPPIAAFTSSDVSPWAMSLIPEDRANASR